MYDTMMVIFIGLLLALACIGRACPIAGVPVPQSVWKT